MYSCSRSARGINYKNYLLKRSNSVSFFQKGPYLKIYTNSVACTCWGILYSCEFPSILAVNFGFFSQLQNSCTWKVNNINMIWESFHMEHNKYCSTFTIDIESLFIQSMNILIWLQANIHVYWYPIVASFRRKYF